MIEAGVETPFGGNGQLGLLELVLLLDSIDAVLALDVGAAGLDAVGPGVDGVGDFHPVFLTEVAAVELQVTVPPGFDQGLGGAFAPAVLTAAARVGPRSVGTHGFWVDGSFDLTSIGPVNGRWNWTSRLAEVLSRTVELSKNSWIWLVGVRGRLEVEREGRGKASE